MTVRTMRMMTKLYNEFIAIETAKDLEQDNLSLSDYNELERVLTVLGGGEISHTYCKNVTAWIRKRVEATITESNGAYVIRL